MEEIDFVYAKLPTQISIGENRTRDLAEKVDLIKKNHLVLTETTEGNRIRQTHF